MIPTLVAVKVAPMNTATVGDSPKKMETKYPTAKGPATPTIATMRADGPTRRNSSRSLSNPTSNNNSMIPSSARNIKTEHSAEGTASVTLIQPSTLPPSTTPAMSSPSTGGCPRRSASSPNTLANTRITIM